MVKLTIDQDKVNVMLDLIQEASKKRRKYFAHDHTVHLPQFNLPEKLEHSPRKREVKDKEASAKLTYSRVALDKRMRSEFLTKYSLETWENPGVNWIFDPRRVAERGEDQVQYAIRTHFHNGLNGMAEALIANSMLLIERYNGNPANLLNGKTVEQSFQEIQQLRGFGRGLARLLQIQLMDRHMAMPLNPEEARFKVDVWKGSLLCNVGAVQAESGIVRADKLAPAGEDSYSRACKANHLTADQIIKMDGLLWAIGSKLCAKNDKRVCERDCPLYGECNKVKWNDTATRYHTNAPDPRKDDGQILIPFYKT